MSINDVVRQGRAFGVSCGLGVDSVAMLVGLAARGYRPSSILFADTGAEKPETYDYIPTLQTWLKRWRFPELTVVQRKPHRQGKYDDIEGQCLSNNTLPSLAFGGRKCSAKWKHEPMDRWRKSHQPAQDAWARGDKYVVAIGYDAGPKDCRRPNIASDEHFDYVYPLREWGWDRETCAQWIQRAGLPVPEKSSCFFCPAMKPDEVRQLDHDHLRRIIQIEAAADVRQAQRRADGQTAIDGLWRRGTKGRGGATKKPGSMSEFIAGEGLLPGLANLKVDPWWLREGMQQPTNSVTPTAVLEALNGRVREPEEVPAKRPDMASPLDRALYFPSGSNLPGEIAGFREGGWNVGVSASEILQRQRSNHTQGDGLHELKLYAETDLKVFVDSGAFSEIAFGPGGPTVVDEITDEQWRERLEMYIELGILLHGQLYAVAPDRVGDQEVTLQRLETYREYVHALRCLGVKVIVPIQKGARSLSEFDAAVSELLSWDGYIRGLPMKKAATTTQELDTFLAETQTKEVHLLGLGLKSRRATEVADVLARHGVVATYDSVLIRAHVGRTRAITLNNGTVADELAALALHDNDVTPDAVTLNDGYSAALWSEQQCYASLYTSKNQRREMVQGLDLTLEQKKWFVDDPDGMLWSAIDHDNIPLSGETLAWWNEHPGLQLACRTAWVEWTTGRGSVRYRKEKTVLLTFAA